LLEKFKFKETFFMLMIEDYKNNKSSFGEKPFEIKNVWNGFKLRT